MKLICGVTTAPRSEPTLSRCLESLMASGFEPIVFAEPETDVPPGYDVRKRLQTLGAFGNWTQSLRDLLESDADAIMLCQDDIVCCRGLREWLEANLFPTERTGFVSAYCPSHYANGNGLVRITTANTWGACALVFPREVVAELLECRVIRGWTHTRKVDMACGKALQHLKREAWYLSPSPCQHIGKTSTLVEKSGLHGRRVAADFLGEETDIRDVWRWSVKR